MAEFTLDDLRLAIDRGDFGPLYLFFGEEGYLTRTYYRRVIDALVPPAARTFNLHEFDGEKTDSEEIFSALSTYPFLSEKSCVAVSSLPVDSLSAEDLRKFERYFADPNPTAVLILYYPQPELQKKTAKWTAFLKTFKKYGTAVSFDRKTPQEAEKLLCAYAARLSCELSRADARYLIERCGNDLQLLFNELEKLCAYSTGGEITRKTIDRVASVNLETTVFILARAIVSGESDRAYELLDQLYHQNEKPISILSALSTSYTDLYRVKAALTSGYEARYVGEIFPYKGRDFVLDNAQRAVRRMSVESLRESLRLLCETDVLLKSTAAERHRRLLEAAIAKLFRLRAGGGNA